MCEKKKIRHAVALKHEMRTPSLPIVLAKGTGDIAQKIIEIAISHGILVESNESLVNLLDTLSIGEQIPIEAFVAIAEILRYIYIRNGMFNNLNKV